MNAISETIQCAKCGAAIKNVFDYQGKTYGSECIESILGFTPKSRNADKAVADRAESVRLAAQHTVYLQNMRAENQKYIDACEAAREFTDSEFPMNMAGLLRSMPFSELSDKQQAAVLKLYKKYGTN